LLISHPCRFTQEKESIVTTAYEAGWAPEPVWMIWRREKLFLLPGIESRFVQPITAKI
jgi:hypothetical protein